uniref:Secreted protein n=1 Tax=Ixodes ricinus TaxID=34613 RepID=A0A0K8R6U7_IXORI
MTLQVTHFLFVLFHMETLGTQFISRYLSTSTPKKILHKLEASWIFKVYFNTEICMHALNKYSYISKMRKSKQNV